MSAWICATCGNHYPEGESPVPRDQAREVPRSSADRYIQFLRGEVAVD